VHIYPLFVNAGDKSENILGATRRRSIFHYSYLLLPWYSHVTLEVRERKREDQRGRKSSLGRRKEEGGRGRKEGGRRKEKGGRRKKEGGRRKEEGGRRKNEEGGEGRRERQGCTMKGISKASLSLAFTLNQ
jgi:hypothetical protein